MSPLAFSVRTLWSLIVLPSLVLCWGDLGHRTVGYLSAKYMTTSGLAFFNDVIKPTTTFDISDAAVWADRIKRNRPNTKEWHFIDAQDNPPSDCKVNYNRDCAGRDGCVVSAILNMVSPDSFLPFHPSNIPRPPDSPIPPWTTPSTRKPSNSSSTS
jgi:hypothetical protein